MGMNKKWMPQFPISLDTRTWICDFNHMCTKYNSSLFHVYMVAYNEHRWSYGILLWEIFTLGGVPYPSLANPENLYEILLSGYRMKKPTNCSDDMYVVMHLYLRHCYFSKFIKCAVFDLL